MKMLPALIITWTFSLIDFIAYALPPELSLKRLIEGVPCALEIDDSGTVLGDVICDITPDGSTATAYIRATSDDLELDLQVWDMKGELVDETHKLAGETWSPVAIVMTREPTTYCITVLSRGSRASGTAKLELRVARESEKTIEACRESISARVTCANLTAQGEHVRARDLLREQVELLASTPGRENSRWIAGEFHWLARALYRAGETRDAGRAMRLSSDFDDAFLLGDHPAKLEIRAEAAEHVLYFGSPSVALQTLSRVVNSASRTTRRDSLQVLQWRILLGKAQRACAKHMDARATFVDVIRLLSELFPTEEATLCHANIELGATLLLLGDAPAARTLIDDAIDRLRHVVPADDALLFQARAVSASVLVSLGDYEAARDVAQRLIQQSRDVSGYNEMHLMQLRLIVAMGSILNRPADCYSESMNDKGQASDTAGIMGVLSHISRLPDLLVALQNRDVPKAETLAQELSRKSSDVPAADKAVSKVSRFYLALTLGTAGEFGRADAIYEELLGELDGQEDVHDDYVLESIKQYLALRRALDGDLTTPVRFLRETTGSRRAHLRRVVLTSSPREAGAHAEKYVERLFPALGVARVLGPMLGKDAYDSLIEDAFEESEAIRIAPQFGYRVRAGERAKSPEYVRLLEDQRSTLRDAAAGIDRLLRSEGSQSESIVDHVLRRDAAQRVLQQAILETPRAEGLIRDLRFGDVARALPTGHAAIAIWKTLPFARQDTWPFFAAQPLRYCAFVVLPDRRAELVDLGSTADVRKAVTTWRTLLLRAGNEALAAGDRLRELVFDPLRPLLADVQVIELCAFHDLHAIPWDALPLEGKMVGDRYRVRIRMSLHELLDTRSLASAVPTLVALGGVDYDHSIVNDSQVPPTDPLLQRIGDDPHFGPLPHSLTEVTDILKLHEAAFPSGVRHLVTGPSATRSRLVDVAAHAGVLHLATHARIDSFEAKSLGFAESQQTGTPEIPMDESAARASVLAPLALCEIALAGANLSAADPGRIGGILRGDELADLDLTACDLAVLSACETATSVKDTGAATASLQTALHSAGARSAVTALWKIPDEATSQLMTRFYRCLWERGMPKDEALWQAKKEIRAIQDLNEQPLFPTWMWAGWVLSGDPH